MPDSKPFDVFLSHNGREKSVVEAIAYKLREEGLNPWLDKWYLIPGVRWQGGLADGLRSSSTCAIFIGKDDLGNWESEELDVAQNLAANDSNFRLIPVLLPGLPDPFDPSPLPPFLLSRTWVDFRHGIDDGRAFRRLVCAIKNISPGPEDGMSPIIAADDTKAEIVPYLGLQTFDEADAELFFGRDADIQQLVEKLKASPFLAVIGASGSGKSSLVRAGLVPVLRHNALPNSDKWLIHVLRPGPRPLSELALQLVHLRDGDAQRPGVLTDMEQELRREERTLHNVVRLKLTSLHLKPEDEAQRRVMLVVDQFEEIFTLCHDDVERTRFLDNLLYASAALDGHSIIVLTMRADFYYKCTAHTGLAARISAHQYLVGPMADENLLEAIEGPARLVGLKVEPELLREVVEDVRNQPGSLPLLEYALLEVWNRRRNGMLTLRDYRESGGVKEAVSRRAEAIYETLDTNQQEIVHRVMLRLTQPGEGTDDTRRQAKMNELVSSSEEREAVAEVVNKLTDARLLTTSNDEYAEDSVVEVSHEALIRGWPRLRRWLEEDRAGLRILLRLSEAAQEWHREKHDEGLLYRGARLAVAMEWQARNGSKLNELERGFLAASEALQVREKEEQEAARQRELKLAHELTEKEKQRAETEKRSGRRLRYFLAGVTLLLIVSSVAFVVAYKQRQQALTESKRNEQLLYVSDINLAQQMHLLGNMGRALEILEAYLTKSQELRGFEWYYFMAKYHNERTTLRGHTDYVSDVAFSPDGKTLATGSGDKTVKLWDVASGKEIATLTGHTDFVTPVTFSPDGKTLATASYDKTVKLWDVASRRELGTLQGHTDIIFAVAFSPDGKTLATASRDKTAKLWDVASQKELSTLQGDAGFVTAMAFSPDGKTLATDGVDNTVKLWDVALRRELGTLRGHADIITAVAFSPDGQVLATGSYDKTVKLWDVRSRRELATLMGHTDAPSDVAFSPDGQMLAADNGDNTVKLWDVRSRRELATLMGHTEIISVVAFSPNGKTLATGSYDKTVKLWDVTSQKESNTLQGHTDYVSDVAFSPDGKTLATGSYDKTVKLWDVTSRQELGTLQGHTDTVHAAMFSPDGKTLATGSGDKTVKLWDVGSQQELATLTGHTDQVYAVSFSPDGKTLATASGDRTIELWDVASRKEFAALTGHTDQVYAVAFSPDGKTLATGSYDNTVKLWDVASRKEFATLKRNSSSVKEYIDAVSAVVFSPDGKMLAAGSGDNTVKLWDVASRKELATLTGHIGIVTAVTFSPDGKRLATGSYDNTVKLWDIASMKELATLTGHTDQVYAVMFSPAGNMLATGSRDKTVNLWYAASDADIDFKLNLSK